MVLPLTPSERATLDELLKGVKKKSERQRIETLYRRSIRRKKVYKATKQSRLKELV